MADRAVRRWIGSVLPLARCVDVQPASIYVPDTADQTGLSSLFQAGARSRGLLRAWMCTTCLAINCPYIQRQCRRQRRLCRRLERHPSLSLRCDGFPCAVRVVFECATFVASCVL